MKGSLRRLVTRITRGQGGFTLIEMIVVVGIIAVLAAVIVPNIGKFIGSGEQGAKDAEWESMQTAMNAMMADKAITDVTAVGSGTAPTNDWGDKPAEASPEFLDDYLQSASTVYFYCFDDKGQIQEQFEDATVNCS